MPLSGIRQPFSGYPDRFDFLAVERMLIAQANNDMQGIMRAVMAISPGSLYLLPAVAGQGYAVAVADLDAGFTLTTVLGTQDVVQLLLELALSGLTPFDGLPGNVGIYYASDLAFYLPAVSALLSNGKPAVIGGHSLGGASAVLLASLLASMGKAQIQGVYTIGAPKVGNAAFAASISYPYWRLENSGDIVPSIPQAFAPFSFFPLPALVNSQWGSYAVAGSAITQSDSGSWSNGHVELANAQVINSIANSFFATHYADYYYANTALGQMTPANLMAWAHGFEKPWYLLGLLEEPQPQGEQQQGSVPVPAGFGSALSVYSLDRLGNAALIQTVPDPAPQAWVPKLISLPTGQNACSC